MILLTAENLTKSFAERTLWDGLSFGLNDTDRIGLIGVNGSGKTTLLRVLAGLEMPDSGRVTLAGGARVAFLPQNPIFDEDGTVLDYVFQADTPTMRLLRDYEVLSARLERAPDEAALHDRLHDLTAEMDRLGAWEAETQARTILSRLGVTDGAARLNTLSGGQRKRVALARALVDRAELLILDEPTNHLDVETVAWLEEWLARAPGALLLVTHDRYFLDRVANRTWELDGGRLHRYEGNYERFLAARAERERLEGAIATKRQNLLRKEMAWLRRGARARSTKQKAHIQRVEALAEAARGAPDPRGDITIALGSRRLGKRAVELRHVSKAWGGRAILTDLSYTIEPGDRIGIVGPNGAGKTTLLRLIAGRDAPDAGTVERGETVHIGLYDQESADLPLDRRVLDYVQEGASLIRLADGTKVTASGMLEWFLFPPQQHYSLIEKLSGGERRRLLLLRTLMDQPNVLLLDEPTNDLDIQTLTVLEDFLDHFPGTVLAVSHDRYFLDRVADFILAVEGDGTAREFPGNYSLYREMRGEERGERREERGEKRAESGERGVEIPKLPDAKGKPLTSKERRDLEGVEGRIAALEAQLAALGEEMNAAGSDYAKLTQLQAAQASVEAELEPLMERWLELSERATSPSAPETRR